MHVSALDHIVLNVADVERSLEFYERCLGLHTEETEQWRCGESTFPSLRVNDETLIELAAGPAARNLAHICLVTDDTELMPLMAELARMGVSIQEGPVIRSGARGNGVSIYFRDPDQNLVEVRTYARRPLIRAVVDDTRVRIRSAIDAMQDPAMPVAGNEAWSQKDLIAHLTSIAGWWRKQIEIVLYTRPWDFESVHDFNDRAVAERRDWNLDDLAHELEREAAALQALLETVDESELHRVYHHPQRAPRELAEGWMMIHSHATRHLSELPHYSYAEQ